MSWKTIGYFCVTFRPDNESTGMSVPSQQSCPTFYSRSS